MQICVTGGAGFLGSHLTEALLREGHSVVVIDSMLTGCVDNLRQAKATYGDRLEVRCWDILKFMDEPRRWKKVRFDYVFNFACPASPVAYQADPIHTMMTCVIGTRNVLELALMDGATVIHASTSEIYGDPEVHPQSESYKGCVNTLGPRACYDEGKRAAETILFDYKRTRGSNIKVARIFNTYGPRMAPNDGRVVSNFIVAALRGEYMKIYGDGRQTRSFCYVDDLIAGFLALMKTPKEFTGPVNLGNPVEFSMWDLAHLVRELLPESPIGIVAPLPQDDPKQRCPDITLAREMLQWEPNVQLKEGLEKTIEYFRGVL